MVSLWAAILAGAIEVGDWSAPACPASLLEARVRGGGTPVRVSVRTRGEVLVGSLEVARGGKVRRRTHEATSCAALIEVLALGVELAQSQEVALAPVPASGPAQGEAAEAHLAAVEPTQSRRTESQGREAARAEAKPAETRPTDLQRGQSQGEQSKRSGSQRKDSQRTEPQRADSQRTEPQRADSQRTEPQRADSQRADSQRADSQRADSQRADSQRADSQRADSQRVEQRVEAFPEVAQRVEAQRVEAQRADAQRADAQRADAQRVEAQRVEAQRVEAQRVEAQRVEAQRVEAQRVEAQRVEAQHAVVAGNEPPPSGPATESAGGEPAPAPPPMLEAPDPRASPLPSGEEGTTTRVELGAHAVFLFGTAPAATFGAELSASLLPAGLFRLELSVQHSRSTTLALGPSRARFSLTTARLGACSPALKIGPANGALCASVAAGAIWAQGFVSGTIASAHEVTLPWVDAAAQARLTVRLTTKLVAEARAGPTFPINRHTFVFDTPTVTLYQTPIVGFEGGLGLAFTP